MLNQDKNQNKNSFKKGVFFGLGILIAGLSYAVVASLNIEDKQDDANDSTGRLTASEFNQLPRILQSFRTNVGNFGIGIVPTEKLHVDGNILATGTLTVNGDTGLTGEVLTGGMLIANNLRSKCEEGYYLQGFDQTTGDLVCANVGGESVTLTADPTSISGGESTTLTWTSTGMVSCSAGWTELVTTSGSELLTNLVENTTYSISCVNNEETNFSDEVTVTVGFGGVDGDQRATVPSAPGNLRALAGDAQVGLAWTAPTSNGGAEITSYELNRTDIDLGDTVLTQGIERVPYLDDTVTNGTTYSYEVRAVNEIGAGSWSGSQNVTPSAEVFAPGVVTAFSASSGNEQMNLSWSAPLDDGGGDITEYLVERSDDNGTNWSSIATPNTISYADTSFTYGTNLEPKIYYYRVSAKNASGYGPATDMILGPPVVRLTIEPLRNVGDMNSFYYGDRLGTAWESAGVTNEVGSCVIDWGNLAYSEVYNEGTRGYESGDSREIFERNTTYTITCTGIEGDTDTASISLTVDPSYAWGSWNNVDAPTIGDGDTETVQTHYYDNGQGCAAPVDVRCDIHVDNGVNNVWLEYEDPDIDDEISHYSSCAVGNPNPRNDGVSCDNATYTGTCLGETGVCCDTRARFLCTAP